MKPPEPISINTRPTDLPQSQFRPSDIAYILFRHKWKIILCSLTGIAAAAVLFLTTKPVYISQAKLLIRYVQENRGVSPMESGDAIRSPDSRGDNILNSEIELITSLDLAMEVAGAVGATNIVGPVEADPATASAIAAGMVRGGIDVTAPRKSNVLLVSYRHGDPATARNVLTNLVSSYLRMHARVHRALGVLDDLGRQADMRRRDLNDIQTQLREIKDALGITSLEEAKLAHADQLNRIKQDLLSTEALLAEAKASLGYAQTNVVTTITNEVPTIASSTPLEIPREKLAAYEAVLLQLEGLKKRRQDLLLQYTEEHLFVTKLRDRIATVENERTQLEAATPGLATHAERLASNPSTGNVGSARIDRSAEIARVAGLEARWNTLQKQLTQILSDRAKLAAKESDIAELELKRAQFEKDYRYYASAVEEARVDAALTSGRLANISVVQAASPAARDVEKFYKILAGVLGGGLVLGLGLALGLEFYGDQSLRRPTQVARSLNIPVFLTVPRMSMPQHSFEGKALLKDFNDGSDASPQKSEHLEADPPSSPLDSYAEALRDRVIMHFQLRELHHKPKLIGVTSCGRNSGTTTMATHLAASLSETGEGNVLYVDANPELGPSVQAFYRGKQAAGVASALDRGAREATRVNENFYMAALNDNPIPGKVGVLPKKLANLLPKIKASDFDYIIFDLPPVTQTSATARVAGLLDMTLLVLESEKTHSDLAKQVTGLLKQSRADVAAVLNKHKRYIPQRMDSDL